ncbi:EUKARYOTIC TRANSLATION INITIATION FACTOR SUI1 [Salix koriyanagi]|uniref:EUKARYOTIC TRANSLATION INITIATION FACTOR SUI1 n=1 Tax=Salix koriyanagi TaxID=2511006 RepID=A0A9Q0UPU3_9ROSI|nr:EUKARYOTIC TRANSLATION INITIATION FACTOR SUI1 [Salix koriyanagi]
MSSRKKLWENLAGELLRQVRMSSRKKLWENLAGEFSDNYVMHSIFLGGLEDLPVPVETSHLDKMFEDVIKHEQGFDLDCVLAVVELYRQVDADIDDENLHPGMSNSECGTAILMAPAHFMYVPCHIKSVCEHCSEVQIGLFIHPKSVNMILSLKSTMFLQSLFF